MQGPLKYDLHVVESVKSTNTTLKAWAKDGAPEGTVLAALSQTNGRGRYNRVFYSPKGSGLYVSVLIRPSVPLPPSALTCMSAVAVAETIEGMQKTCAIKWVNDICIDGKKVAGILTEGAILPDGRYDFAVVGIGVNLFPPEGGFPDAIREIAGSVFDGEPDEEIRKAFLKKLLQRIRYYYELLPELPFADAYRQKQMIYGKEVLFTDSGRTQRGLAAGIDPDFRLIVTASDGTEHALDRGDVTIL